MSNLTILCCWTTKPTASGNWTTSCRAGGFGCSNLTIIFAVVYMVYYHVLGTGDLRPPNTRRK